MYLHSGAAMTTERLREVLDDLMLGTEDWADYYDQPVPITLLRDIRTALSEDQDSPSETEPCPTCMQPVPVPQRGDHDYGLSLRPLDSPSEGTLDPLCARCKHGHTEAAWSDKDPNDGTCWSAGFMVCGCPKFITPAVAAIRAAALTEANRV